MDERSAPARRRAGLLCSRVRCAVRHLRLLAVVLAVATLSGAAQCSPVLSCCDYNDDDCYAFPPDCEALIALYANDCNGVSPGNSKLCSWANGVTNGLVNDLCGFAGVTCCDPDVLCAGVTCCDPITHTIRVISM